MFNSVHAFLETADSSLISKCLMPLAAECVLVTKRQLNDFLIGPFSSHINTDSTEFEQLRHCPLTNLVGESAFGDLDLDLQRKPNRKMFSRSASHAFNRNKTASFLASKSKSSREMLFSIARRKSRELLKQEASKEKMLKNKVREKMVENQEKKIQRKIKEISVGAEIMRRVEDHGGPCHSASDVDMLVQMMQQQGKKEGAIAEAIKDELRYQKSIKQCKGLTLKGKLFDLTERLKDHLQ